MFRKRLIYLFTKNKSVLGKYFLICFGTIWLLIECSSSLSKGFKTWVEPHGPGILISAIIVSILFGSFRAFPQLKISRKFKGSNTSIVLKVSDLLNEPGNIVVGSSDYFDTDYDVNSNVSLKSKVINTLFSSDKASVDKLIDQSLNIQNLGGEFIETKPSGKKTKFPIGTIAILPHQQRKVFILVLSCLTFDSNGKHTFSTPEKLNSALSCLWNKMKVEGKMKEFSVPVLGSGLSQINLSFLILIQILILSFVVYSKQTRITERLNIVVHESNYDPEDFNEVSQFLRSIQI